MKKLLALIVLVVLISSSFWGHSLIKAMADEPVAPVTDRYYTSIQIEKGDSLWSIANRYAKDGDLTTSEYITELKSMNSLKEDTIHTGQYLTIVYFSQD